MNRQSGFDGYNGTTTCSLEITAVANTYSTAASIAAAITNVLDYYHGTVTIAESLIAHTAPTIIVGGFGLLGPVTSIAGGFATTPTGATTPLTIQAIFLEDGSTDDKAIDPDNRDMVYYSKSIKFSVTFEG